MNNNHKFTSLDLVYRHFKHNLSNRAERLEKGCRA